MFAAYQKILGYFAPDRRGELRRERADDGQSGAPAMKIAARRASDEAQTGLAAYFAKKPPTWE